MDRLNYLSNSLIKYKSIKKVKNLKINPEIDNRNIN